MMKLVHGYPNSSIYNHRYGPGVGCSDVVTNLTNVKSCQVKSVADILKMSSIDFVSNIHRYCQTDFWSDLHDNLSKHNFDVLLTGHFFETKELN